MEALQTIVLGLITCVIWASVQWVAQHIKKIQSVTYSL